MRSEDAVVQKICCSWSSLKQYQNWCLSIKWVINTLVMKQISSIKHVFCACIRAHSLWVHILWELLRVQIFYTCVVVTVKPNDQMPKRREDGWESRHGISWSSIFLLFCLFAHTHIYLVWDLSYLICYKECLISILESWNSNLAKTVLY